MDQIRQGGEIGKADTMGDLGYGRFAVAFGVKKKGQIGVQGGFGINFAITDKKRARAVQGARGRMQGGGVRLFAVKGVTCNDRGKVVVQTQMGHDSARRGGGFIGANGKVGPCSLQGIKCGKDTGIGFGQGDGCQIVFGQVVQKPGVQRAPRVGAAGIKQARD